MWVTYLQPDAGAISSRGTTSGHAPETRLVISPMPPTCWARCRMQRHWARVTHAGPARPRCGPRRRGSTIDRRWASTSRSARTKRLWHGSSYHPAGCGHRTWRWRYWHQSDSCVWSVAGGGTLNAAGIAGLKAAEFIEEQGLERIRFRRTGPYSTDFRRAGSA